MIEAGNNECPTGAACPYPANQIVKDRTHRRRNERRRRVGAVCQAGTTTMPSDRNSEPKQTESRPLQFRMRTLFVWTTVLAVISASVGGAFGVPFKMATIAIIAILLCFVASMVVAFAWFILIWLFQQMAASIKNCRHRDH